MATDEVATEARQDPSRWLDAGLLTSCALALLALAPLLVRGYVLTYDMVFVPDPPLVPGLLGLDGAVPRAVPSDALVALAARLLPADVVQKLILAAVFVLGGWGAARLLPSDRAAARAAAAAFFAWNAYVYERLLLGHWTLLVSYAALPWVVRAARDLRDDRAAWSRVVLGLAAASAGSATGGLVGTVTALLVVGARARAWLVAAAGAVLALPWLVPSLLRPDDLPARPEGVEAFAARADSALGVLGSLLTLGGAWNPSVTPPGRDSLLAVPALLVLLALAVAGLPALWRRLGPGLFAAAGLGLLLALPLTRPPLTALVEALPGAGLLRDTQRHLAPLALLQALGFGLTVERLARGRLTSVALVAGPVLALPVLALGAGGRLAAVTYPPGYGQARAVAAADPAPGAVLVLPFNAYLAPAWNGGRAVLDPATRLFPRRTVTSGDLVAHGIVVAGEDPYAARLADAAPDRLDDLGVRYVLVNKLGPWQRDAARLSGLELVLDDPVLRLYRTEGPTGALPPGPPPALVLAGDAAAAALTLAALSGWAVERSGRLVRFSRRATRRSGG